jgi:hypothetical protein
LDDLTEYQSKIKDLIYPKKKFAFSNKKAVNNLPLETTTTTPLNEIKTSKQFENESDDFLLKDKINEKIVISQDNLFNKNNLIIENVNNCEIYLLQNFKACYIKNIQECKIFIGSVSGGTHITNANQTSFYIATHQLRIHKTYKSLFFIISTSNPIIEDCSELTFLPLNVEYDTFNDNLKVIIYNNNFFS